MPGQVVSYDFGRHNADLEKSASRVFEGASWKDQSTILILPASKMVPSKAALSWMNIISAPNNKFYRMLTVDMEVGDAYTTAINFILSHPDLSTWKYILTLEHDNIPPPSGLLTLYKDMDEHPEYSVIGGLYWTKGEEGIPQMWGDPTDPQLNFRPQVPIPNTVQEVCGTGMGFTLWRMSIFKDPHLSRPFFKTQTDYRGVATQDLSFWLEARSLGYRCAIDTNVLVGHLDADTSIIW